MKRSFFRMTRAQAAAIPILIAWPIGAWFLSREASIPITFLVYLLISVMTGYWRLWAGTIVGILLASCVLDSGSTGYGYYTEAEIIRAKIVLAAFAGIGLLYGIALQEAHEFAARRSHRDLSHSDHSPTDENRPIE